MCVVGCTPRVFPMGKPTLRLFVIHILFLFGFHWSAAPQGHFRWASQPYALVSSKYYFCLVFIGRLKPTLHACVIYILFLFGFHWSAAPQGYFRWASQPYDLLLSIFYFCLVFIGRLKPTLRGFIKKYAYMRV